MVLSKRLQAIADRVLKDGITADIGTDHAQIPIYLLREKLAPRVILTDNKDGPLRKAKENLFAAGVTVSPEDLRKGDGLTVLNAGEVATVIIAGMGGLLIADMLSADIQKSLSFQRLILQPRTASAELRRWLTQNGFHIAGEQLAPEGRRLCEIITAEPGEGTSQQNENRELLDYEISPLLLAQKDPFLKQFIDAKIRETTRIRHDLERSRDADADLKIQESEERIRRLTERKSLL